MSCGELLWRLAAGAQHIPARLLPHRRTTDRPSSAPGTQKPPGPASALPAPLDGGVCAGPRGSGAPPPPYLEASEPLRTWADKCAVVPLGLQAPAPQAPPSAPPWSTPHLRVLAIGRLAHYKGFGTLIDAVAQTPGVELRIAGDGELRAELAAHIAHGLPAEAAARIHLLGAVTEPDKLALLASCDVFALPSCERTEAFGLVLLEAMAHGKPCLARALPSLKYKSVISSPSRCSEIASRFS